MAERETVERLDLEAIRKNASIGISGISVGLVLALCDEVSRLRAASEVAEPEKTPYGGTLASERPLGLSRNSPELASE